MYEFHPCGESRKRRFSLIELLIAIAVIAILAGLLAPALNAAREKAGTIRCVNSMKQLGIAFAVYFQSSGDFFPTHGENGTYGFWAWHLYHAAKLDPALLLCEKRASALGTINYWVNLKTRNPDMLADPAHFSWQYVCYGYNQELAPSNKPGRISRIKQPSRQVLCVESAFGDANRKIPSITPYFKVGSNYNIASNTAFPIHGEWSICNVLWVDGHTASIQTGAAGENGARRLHEVILRDRFVIQN